MNARGTALAVLAVSLAAGCISDPYCLNCGPLDAGRRDGALEVAPVDVVRRDACRPTNGGMEICDGLDNDCNGRVDEGFDTTRDPRHCGGCGRECRPMNAVAACTAGRCGYVECNVNARDLNGNREDGCEYLCTASGPEVCDGLDNNCDGNIDEGFDRMTDPLHCGRCNNPCQFEHAAASCVSGTCRMGGCLPGFHDINRMAADGCEYACTPSGPEVCDGRDNDCNGTTDDGIDLMADARNCGACGRGCATAHATPLCRGGRCAVGACAPGFADLNGDPSDGCEWACGGLDGRRGPEVCDGRDNDCDGTVDSGSVAEVGSACGPSDRGVCRRGMNVCDRGTLRCVGATMPGPEFCNGLDDDCDGVVDNPPAGGALPGTGPAALCGNNVGACTFGRFACVRARIECSGGTGPSPELCDGLDNNCDGRVDEMVTPPASLRCNTRGPDTQGVCAAAVRVCNGTRGWGCTYPPTWRDRRDEGYCDGLDNNCDGRVDEGCLELRPPADLRLDRLNANSIQPVIAGDGAGTLGVVFIDRRNGASDVFFARSTSDGDTWQPDLRLDTDPAGTHDSVRPALAWLPGGRDVFAGWSDFRTTNEYREVYATASQGLSGGGWLVPDRRANAGDASDSFNLHVVTTAGTVLAVWEGLSNTRARHIYFAYSRDRGGSWSGPARIDRAPDPAILSTPDVAVGAPGRVYVVWRDNRNGGVGTDIFLHASSDGGVSWPGPDLRLDTDAPGSHASELPSVAADARGNVYVAWQEVRTGLAYDIYANRSLDGGMTWLAADVRVDTDPFARDSLHPTVFALPGGAAAVVWQDLRWGLPNVYASRSADAGARWLAADVPVMAGLPGRSSAIDVVAAATGESVFAVWSDNRGGALDVWANYSLDGGASFQPVDLRLDSGPAGSSASETPAVFAAAGAAHVVWVDRRSNGVTGDVYYRSLRPRP